MDQISCRISKMPKTIVVTTLIIIGLFVACRHELPGSLGSSATSGPGSGTGGQAASDTGSCSSDTVYFVQTVLPLLSSSCAQSGCHQGVLDNYAGIMSIVSPGDPGGSDLISIIASGRMPPRGHTALTAGQLAQLSTWIKQGANNNGCVSAGCDTSNVTYSKTIAGILQTNCTGCHSGSAPSGGGIDLSTYSGVLIQANNGKLWGDVGHLSGYNAMPLGGSMLSACDLSKIRVWIRAGAPNN